MFKEDKNFEVVQKYYFRKNGIVETTAYDWIGDAFCGLYPIELDGKLGFADCNGEIVIPIIYDRRIHINNTVWAGNSEYFVMGKDGLYGLITHDGTEIIEFQWEDMDLAELSENLMPVKKENRWGFVNVMTKKTQVQPAYDDVRCFKNGYAPVCIDEKWGLIDTNGNLIVQPKYLTYSYFIGNFVLMIKKGGSWYREKEHLVETDGPHCAIVNKKGYEIISGFDCIERIGIDTFRLTKFVNGWHEVSTIKQFITFPNYIIVIDNGKYLKGYLTPQGEYFKDWVQDEYLIYCPYAKYAGGGAWSAIDYTGKAIKMPEFYWQK